MTQLGEQSWGMSMQASTVRVPKRNFDGLFVHALKPTGNFARSLLAIGYDPDAEFEHYPLEVWRAALRVARENAFPSLPAEKANRVLGHRYVEGFAQTLVGRIFAAAAPLLGTERCLARIPTYLRAGREDMRMLLDAVHEREWRVLVEDVDPLPDFVAGVLEAVLLRTRAEPQVEVIDFIQSRYTLRVRW